MTAFVEVCVLISCILYSIKPEPNFKTTFGIFGNSLKQMVKIFSYSRLNSEYQQATIYLSKTNFVAIFSFPDYSILPFLWFQLTHKNLASTHIFNAYVLPLTELNADII